MTLAVVETDYRTFKNRCPHCAHRLLLREGSRCTVVSGDGNDPNADRRCPCRRHVVVNPLHARLSLLRAAWGRCEHRILNGVNIIATCQLPTWFFGVRGFNAKAETWRLADCGFYTVSNIDGVTIRMTREEPPRGYFNHNHEDVCKGIGHRAG